MFVGSRNVPLLISLIVNTCLLSYLLLQVPPGTITNTATFSRDNSGKRIPFPSVVQSDSNKNGVGTNGTRFPVLQELSCVEFPRPRRHKTRLGGVGFWAWHNFLPPSRKVGCNEGVTLALHGTYADLHRLVGIVNAWNGPVSLTLFAPASDFSRSLLRLSYLIACKKLSLETLSIHLLFPENHLPKSRSMTYDLWRPGGNSSEDFFKWTNCSTAPVFGERVKATYATVNNLEYPVGEARNMAKDNAMTHFVLEAELDVQPSPKLAERFFDMLRRDGYEAEGGKVFVLNAFELTAEEEGREALPQTKAEVREWLRGGKAEWVGVDCEGSCSRFPFTEEWEASEVGATLETLEEPWEGRQLRGWTPYFISGGGRGDPRWLEHFPLLRRRDRIVQMYAMCLLNFNLAVIDGDAFLLKFKKTERENRRELPGWHLKDTKTALKLFIERFKHFYGSYDREALSSNLHCQLNQMSLYF